MASLIVITNDTVLFEYAQSKIRDITIKTLKDFANYLHEISIFARLMKSETMRIANEYKGLGGYEI